MYQEYLYKNNNKMYFITLRNKNILHLIYFIIKITNIKKLLYKYDYFFFVKASI